MASSRSLCLKGCWLNRAPPMKVHPLAIGCRKGAQEKHCQSTSIDTCIPAPSLFRKFHPSPPGLLTVVWNALEDRLRSLVHERRIPGQNSKSHTLRGHQYTAAPCPIPRSSSGVRQSGVRVFQGELCCFHDISSPSIPRACHCGGLTIAVTLASQRVC
jgi:hypothetical protein